VCLELRLDNARIKMLGDTQSFNHHTYQYVAISSQPQALCPCLQIFTFALRFATGSSRRRGHTIRQSKTVPRGGIHASAVLASFAASDRAWNKAKTIDFGLDSRGLAPVLGTTSHGAPSIAKRRRGYFNFKTG